MSFVKALPKTIADTYDLVLISPRNYFLYTPLLPALASGTMEPRSIVEPVRNQIVGKGTYYEAACQSIDVKNKELVCCFPADAGLDSACFKVPYDALMVAVGSVNNTFGVQGVEEHCHFFKSIEDARALRARISELFERAALPHTPLEEKRRLLSFVIVGGGPTGVEVAAEIYDKIEQDLSRLYPELTKLAKVSIIELTDHVLGTYDRKISNFTKQQFERAGISARLNTKVSAVGPRSVTLVNPDGSEEQLPFGAAVWCTGVRLNPLAETLIEAINEVNPGVQRNMRSIVTDQHLRVLGTDGSIYAIGDAATIYQPRALEKCEELFQRADANADGVVGVPELRSIIREAQKEYPHLEAYADLIGEGQLRFGGLVKKILQRRGKATDPSKLKGADKLLRTVDDDNNALDLEGFRDLLAQIDSNLRLLPPTAQVARQQGEYLAKLFTSTKVEGKPDDVGAEAIQAGKKTYRPFTYNHKGSLAYVGRDNAVMDIPVIGPIMGKGAGVGWKAFETLSQISFRNQALVTTDWLRSKIFGRDISRF
ncbi:unnamed protein product [Pedinophyceae sp. YPF-701]|nr:unnamed protein product [Pedinophyceae sp. YPF-701]